eukprot:TRINITY_DN1057_c0_g1_i1.p1 TRINITY_DN1057_c0_g1~~TRINITY_DN1057_c0_g1_i1.p1  ORF type:complete len:296 (+),score=64.89 TRINITY_DN1057_c0_g1_i1:3-890(+)
MSGGSVDGDRGGGQKAIEGLKYVQFRSEEDLPAIMSLIDRDLSEPYSIFTYRYFISQWPQLCYMAVAGGECVGAIVCKMDNDKRLMRGYIAMLVVSRPFRSHGIATELVTRCVAAMRESGCQEVALEAEVTNKGALALYGNLGFLRSKLLHRYYLNGVDAFRLKLQFPSPGAKEDELDSTTYCQSTCCSNDHSHEHAHHHDHEHSHVNDYQLWDHSHGHGHGHGHPHDHAHSHKDHHHHHDGHTSAENCCGHDSDQHQLQQQTMELENTDKRAAAGTRSSKQGNGKARARRRGSS